MHLSFCCSGVITKTVTSKSSSGFGFEASRSYFAASALFCEQTRRLERRLWVESDLVEGSTLSLSRRPPLRRLPKTLRSFGVGGFCPNSARPFCLSCLSAAPVAALDFISCLCGHRTHGPQLKAKLFQRHSVTHLPFLARTFWDSG